MEIKCVGVIGGGTMGSGIAQVMATAGLRTILIDRDDIQVVVGISRIKHGLEKAVEKGKINTDEMERIRGLIEGKTDLGSAAECDLVVEAVPEDLKIKTQIFHYVAAICVPETIIASNTSSISITAMAAATTHPEQFIGMHFMNPAPVMPLVEVIRGLKTSDENAGGVGRPSGVHREPDHHADDQRGLFRPDGRCCFGGGYRCSHDSRY